MIDTSTKELWALAEGTLKKLLQEGGAFSLLQAAVLEDALKESKSLGRATSELMETHCQIITTRAQALIESIEEGRMPAQPPHRQGFKN